MCPLHADVRNGKVDVPGGNVDVHIGVANVRYPPSPPGAAANAKPPQPLNPAEPPKQGLALPP